MQYPPGQLAWLLHSLRKLCTGDPDPPKNLTAVFERWESLSQPPAFPRTAAYLRPEGTKDPSAAMDYPELCQSTAGAVKREFNAWDISRSGGRPFHCDPQTCSEISMFWMFLCSCSSPAFCRMINRRHSIVAKIMAALSEGLDVARSLDNLKQTDQDKGKHQLKNANIHYQ